MSFPYTHFSLANIPKKHHSPSQRSEPECVTFCVENGRKPSPKPPVRIYLGTEPAQLRAERVFVWSIKKVRDPSRVYEIYLMKDLLGFDRSKWTTGFTNYRFAIPHFTQGQGRAIYNDVDQIYLEDPATLFDMKMGNHGYLAIGEAETSVMLLNCTCMAKVWSLSDAQHLPKKKILANTLAIPNLYGPLQAEWNARDEEYSPGKSKVFHFTTLHTQPWRPSPKTFVYENHPFAEVWMSLEQMADSEKFQVFTKHHPSQQFREWRTQGASFSEHSVSAEHVDSKQPLSSQSTLEEQHRKAIEAFAEKADASTVLLYEGEGRRNGHRQFASPTQELSINREIKNTVQWERYNLRGEEGLQTTEAQYDGVVCLNWLNHIPDEDIPWVLDDIWAKARQFVYLALPCSLPSLRERMFPSLSSSTSNHTIDWWKERIQTAARPHPHIHWTLATALPSNSPNKNLWFHQGGAFLSHSTPSVWILTDDRPGNSTQSLGLAEALSWPFTVKELIFLPKTPRFPQWSQATLLGLDLERSSPITPPWPDLVIAAGKRNASIARWIGNQSHGRTRLIHLGRKGGHIPDPFDVVVTPTYCQLPPHPKRIETAGPLTRVTPEKLAQAKKAFPELWGDSPTPHVLLLVGGATTRFKFDAELATKLCEAVNAFTKNAGGTLRVLTSRRTGQEATVALKATLEQPSQLLEWVPGNPLNPYLAYLASADVIVVTGESESMLAEVAATGKPMYIYALPEQPLSFKGRMNSWITTKARSRPANNRGTVRPQQGLEYFCSRLIEEGVILPLRDLSTLHQSLINLGVAKPFGTPLETWIPQPLQETTQVAQQIKLLLQLENIHQEKPDTSAQFSATSSYSENGTLLNKESTGPKDGTTEKNSN